MRIANESQRRNDFKYDVFVTLPYIWPNGLWELKVILAKWSDKINRFRS